METVAQHARTPSTPSTRSIPAVETDSFTRANFTRPFRRPIPIALDKIVVVTKLTKIECDMQSLGLSFDEVVKSYQGSGADVARIVNSHYRQKAGIVQLQKLLPQARVISRRALERSEAGCSETENAGSIFAGADLVLAFGGDNHFQFVSQSVRGELPILGINSDALTSYGALLSATAEELHLVVEALKAGTFEFESWTRLALTLDGKKLEPATSEVFAGEVERKYMSRHVLSRESEEPLRAIAPDEQKGSGFLVATGSGSSGWFQSASRYIHPEGTSYSKTDREAHFIQTEPSTTVVRPGKARTRTIPPHVTGNLLPGETLRIQSLNDQHGIVTVDSLAEYSFPRGQVLEVAVAEDPLWVVTFPKGLAC